MSAEQASAVSKQEWEKRLGPKKAVQKTRTKEEAEAIVAKNQAEYQAFLVKTGVL